MCAAILGWLLAKAEARADIAWVMVAFAFSAAGDYFLSTKGESAERFIIGIGLFLLAHVGYILAAWKNGRLHVPSLIVLLAVFLPYYALLLRPAIAEPPLALAVLGYLLISCLALAVAAGMRWVGLDKAFYVSGIALIVFSDTLISFTEFLGFSAFDWLILPTYYLAHIAITTGFIRQVTAPQPAPTPA